MPTVKSRREQYSDATRAAILDAATTSFAERGFAATTLEDVATAVRATRGAVYHHFAGKRALFEAVFGEMEQHTMDIVAAAAATVSDPLEAADAAIIVFLDRCCDPMYGRIAWQEGPVALGLQAWKECEERYAYGFIEQTVRALREAGAIDPVPVVTTSRYAFALLGAAGQELAEAGEREKPRVKAECLELLRRFLAALRPGPASR